MEILLCKDYEQLSRTAAEFVQREIEQNPRCVLGLATGSTPLGLYRELAALHRQGLDFSSVTTFNLDEYLGLGPDHPASYCRYMQENLFQHINVPPENIHIPDGQAENPDQECWDYERRMAAAGGIDLQILGIGHNGHIGFNEPGTPFGQTTHVVDLDERTIEANARFFGHDLSQVPRRAISMGIKSIMRARKIVLLASGSGKADAVAAAAEGPVTPDLPASVLQLHPQAAVLVDAEAGSKISRENPELRRS